MASPESVPERFEAQLQAEDDASTAIDLLASASPLSRQKLKQCMDKGGVWLNKARGGRRRIRRARTPLRKGDRLELHYDRFILSSEPPVPRLIADRQAYSVWFKPENMLSQGSKFADHCAITRWVEKHHEPRRAVYLVHRLDRAASGLMLLAHDRKTAAKLSRLFAARAIRKCYRVEVAGEFDLALPLSISTPLDGKDSETIVLSARPGEGSSMLTLEIKSGRKHQIRRHLSGLGWPVMGDRLYGGDDVRGALKLTAHCLSFQCPVSGEAVTFRLDDSAGQLIEQD